MRKSSIRKLPNNILLPPRYSYEILTLAVYEIKTIEYDIVDVNVSRQSLLIIFPATPKTGVMGNPLLFLLDCCIVATDWSEYNLYLGISRAG